MGQIDAYWEFTDSLHLNDVIAPCIEILEIE